MALRTNTLQSPAYTSTAASSSSLVTPSLTLLADPPIRLADGAALDYLMIEMVGVLRESAGVANERVRKVEREMKEAGLVDATSGTGAGKEKGKKEGRESIGVGVPGGGAGGTRSRVSSIAGMSTVGDIISPAPAGPEESDEEESVRTRLEAIGLHIGGNVAERLCRDRPRFGDTLDVVKFICKDVWSACWDKQVDNLRTNHRGVYVLQDNQFKPITRISSYDGPASALRRARTHIALSVGIIKGALARMGYQATVTPEIQHVPQCTFQIKLPRG
ncbi:transport particle component [Pyrrhoderma noxium]|uniref:Transport particle component n=1 Tax=Pyrrhoderma noxium TaxID=2282107 RepID=A0A286UQ74_9AGAM|nr:transport particle component [Pyrrhoderma noxium]